MSCLLPTSRLGQLASKQYPPLFLAPALFSFYQVSASFSTSSSVSQRTTRKKHVRHPNRGVSALRRTGLRHPVEMGKYPLPVPVLDPEKRSKVAIDENHGLWGFFRPDKKALNTPEETAAFGRPWVVEELRHKSWEDLHSLWWICCKERNLLATQAYERERLKAGYGEAEILDRNRAVRQTQKAIKHALTERYYAFEDARRVAVIDPEVDLEAEPGTQAYTPIYSDETALESDYPVGQRASSSSST
ncbi:MAG: hypothetical protein LQ337_008676 [Flavoplaca oasis]|nr:MAG: hypothetical protein LQ337_008676 [Flavoplaca oasis]